LPEDELEEVKAAIASERDKEGAREQIGAALVAEEWDVEQLRAALVRGQQAALTEEELTEVGLALKVAEQKKAAREALRAALAQDPPELVALEAAFFQVVNAGLPEQESRRAELACTLLIHCSSRPIRITELAACHQECNDSGMPVPILRVAAAAQRRYHDALTHLAAATEIEARRVLGLEERLEVLKGALQGALDAGVPQDAAQVAAAREAKAREDHRTEVTQALTDTALHKQRDVEALRKVIKQAQEADLELASCAQLKNCQTLEGFCVDEAEAVRLKAEAARLKAEAKDSGKRVEKRRRELEACGLLDISKVQEPRRKRRRRPLGLAVAPEAKRCCRTPARSSSVKTERLWGKNSRTPSGFRPRSPTRARSPSRALSAASALSARHRSVHLPVPPTPDTCPGTPDLMRSGSIARTISATPAFSGGRGVSPTPAPLRNVPSAARQPGESADSLPFDCFRWETHEGQPALIFDISDVTPAAMHRLMEFGVAVGQIVHVDFNKENVRDRGQWIDKTCFFKIPTGATLEKAAGLQVGVMGGNEKTRPRAIGVAMAIVVALEDSSWQKENEARVATTLGHDGFPDFVDHASGSKSKAALSPAQEQFRRLSPPPRRVSPPPLRGQGHKTEEAQMSNAAAANAALPLMLRPAPAHRNQEGRVVLLGRGAVRGRGAQPVGSARGQPSRGAALNGRGNSRG